MHKFIFLLVLKSFYNNTDMNLSIQTLDFFFFNIDCQSTL